MGSLKFPAPVEEKFGPSSFALSDMSIAGEFVLTLREKSQGIWTRRLATSPTLLGIAAFNFGYCNFFFFFNVPSFEQKYCEREVVWNLFICETQGWDGEVTEEVQGRSGGSEGKKAQEGKLP